MMISNLRKDLVEEILSRVPFKYLRAVRSTCKTWNALSKTRSFANKHIDKAAVSGEKECLMITEFDVFLLGLNLHTSQNNNVDLSIKLKGKRFYKKVFYKSQVIHCNGVFLCVWGHMLLVWNPYWGQTKWIMPTPAYNSVDMYALGYNKYCGSHKILRLFGNNQKILDMYHLSSSSWMVPDGTLERDIKFTEPGVSLKGDTYWCAKDKVSIYDYWNESEDYYLLSFDFTSERFGPPLPLPNLDKGYVSLSAVREEKLALLNRKWDIPEMEFWVTSKIEPDAVSWIIFLKVDMKPSFNTVNFLIDEETKVALLFCKKKAGSFRYIYDSAYIIGENGYVRKVDLPESQRCPFSSSYVPSSALIK